MLNFAKQNSLSLLHQFGTLVWLSVLWTACGAAQMKRKAKKQQVYGCLYLVAGVFCWGIGILSLLYGIRAAAEYGIIKLILFIILPPIISILLLYFLWLKDALEADQSQTPEEDEYDAFLKERKEAEKKKADYRETVMYTGTRDNKTESWKEYGREEIRRLTAGQTDEEQET